MPAKNTTDTTGPMTKSEKLVGVSAVVVESPRPRVSVEVERMSRGPAKISIRVDGEDSNAIATEALEIYERMIHYVDQMEPEKEAST